MIIHQSFTLFAIALMSMWEEILTNFSLQSHTVALSESTGVDLARNSVSFLCFAHILSKAEPCQKLLFQFILSFFVVACFKALSISRRFPHGWKSVAVCFYYQVSWMRRQKKSGKNERKLSEGRLKILCRDSWWQIGFTMDDLTKNQKVNETSF